MWRTATLERFPNVPSDLKPARWRDVYRHNKLAWLAVCGRRKNGDVPETPVGLGAFTVGSQLHVPLQGLRL